MKITHKSFPIEYHTIVVVCGIFCADVTIHCVDMRVEDETFGIS
jgi:hypothetical protein